MHQMYGIELVMFGKNVLIEGSPLLMTVLKYLLSSMSFSFETGSRMPFFTKTILTANGLWFGSLIVLFVFPSLSPVMSGLAILLYVPIAVVLLVLALIALIAEKRKRWAIVCICLTVALSYVSLWHATYWGALTHLYLNRRNYERQAEKMLAARTDAERRSICGEKCWVLSSESAVGFHYVHGFLNWHDIVYDPTGKIAVKNWDERKRLDIYFISAEHLTGDWYLGHFGD